MQENFHKLASYGQKEDNSTMIGSDFTPRDSNDPSNSNVKKAHCNSAIKSFRPYFNYPKSKSDLEKESDSISTADHNGKIPTLSKSSKSMKIDFGPRPKPQCPSSLLKSMSCQSALSEISQVNYEVEMALSLKCSSNPFVEYQTIDYGIPTPAFHTPQKNTIPKGKLLKPSLTQKPKYKGMPALRTQRTLGQGQFLMAKETVPLPKVELCKTKTCPTTKQAHNWVSISW